MTVPTRFNALRWWASAVIVVAAHVAAGALVFDVPQRSAEVRKLLQVALLPVPVEEEPPPQTPPEAPVVAEPSPEPPPPEPVAKPEPEPKASQQDEPSKARPAPQQPLPRAANSAKVKKRPAPTAAPDVARLPAAARVAPPSKPVTRSEPEAVAPPRSSPALSKSARGRLVGGYGRGLIRALDPHRRYPAAALRLGLEGIVKIEVRVDRRGKLLTAPVIVRSSGHRVLDDEARALVVRAAPFSPLPAAFDRKQARIVIPVQFVLPQRG